MLRAVLVVALILAVLATVYMLVDMAVRGGRRAIPKDHKVTTVMPVAATMAPTTAAPVTTMAPMTTAPPAVQAVGVFSNSKDDLFATPTFTSQLL